MAITYGPVVTKNVSECSEDKEASEKTEELCYFCKLSVDRTSRLTCLGQNCDLISHVICLSDTFLKDSNEILPVEGDCPSCHTHVLWGDLIRKKRGCFKNLTDCNLSTTDDEI